MNERIRLLAKEAGFDIEEGGHIMLHHVYLTNRMENFAELLVRDCAEFIAPMGDYCGGHGEPSAPSSRECARRLKQYFGVEE